MTLKLQPDTNWKTDYLKHDCFFPWLTDLQVGLVRIYASSIAGNWKKWVITLLSHGGITAKHYGSNWTLGYSCMPNHQAFNPHQQQAALLAVLMGTCGDLTHTEVVQGDKRTELALLGAELMCSHLFPRLLKWKWNKFSLMCHVQYKCSLSQPFVAM